MGGRTTGGRLVGFSGVRLSEEEKLAAENRGVRGGKGKEDKFLHASCEEGEQRVKRP